MASIFDSIGSTFGQFSQGAGSFLQQVAGFANDIAVPIAGAIGQAQALANQFKPPKAHAGQVVVPGEVPTPAPAVAARPSGGVPMGAVVALGGVALLLVLARR